jgi:hypothetical protein
MIVINEIIIDFINVSTAMLCISVGIRRYLGIKFIMMTANGRFVF